MCINRRNTFNTNTQTTSNDICEYDIEWRQRTLHIVQYSANTLTKKEHNPSAIIYLVQKKKKNQTRNSILFFVFFSIYLFIYLFFIFETKRKNSWTRNGKHIKYIYLYPFEWFILDFFFFLNQKGICLYMFEHLVGSLLGFRCLLVVKLDYTFECIFCVSFSFYCWIKWKLNFNCIWYFMTIHFSKFTILYTAAHTTTCVCMCAQSFQIWLNL